MNILLYQLLTGAGRAVFIDPIITTLTFSTDGTFTKVFLKD